jgi:serine phosphatase RsbU (regulator of sigma subunit)
MFFRKKKRPGTEAATGESPSASPDTSSAPTTPEGEADGRKPRGTPTTQFLTGEAGKDRRTVQVLLETIARVSRSRDLEELLTYVVDSSVRLTGATRGLLIMRGEGGGDVVGGLVVRTAREQGGKTIAGDLRYSTSVAAKVLEEGQPVRATVHSESEALELGKSVYDLKLRAVMCVPLNSTEEDGGDGTPPRGVLYVDSRAATRQFTQGDLALFAALAQQISIAMENARLHIDSLEKVRLEQSLELASVIQRDLMPGVPSDLGGWDVHGWYRPAEEAAGDFYDFVKAKDGRLAIVVGDATGHGIGPALITATTQGSLRSFLRLIADPGEVITLLNQDLSERVEDGRFMTLFLALLDDDGTIHGLNAGHALPFVWRAASGDVETIGSNGPALGMIADETYAAHPPLPLAEGDVLVVYTDGLSEARNPAEPEVLFGEDGVREALATAAAEGKDAKGILLHVVEEAMKLSGDTREDDVTIVVARRR